LSVAAAILSAGCGTGVFFQHSPYDGDALDGIVPGRTTRAEMHDRFPNRLGETSDWPVDVFVDEGELTELVIPPLPFTTKAEYYLLAVYDERGRVKEAEAAGPVYRTYLDVDDFRLNMVRGALLAPAGQSAEFATRAVDDESCVFVVGFDGIPKWEAPVALSDQGHRFAPGRDVEVALARWRLAPGVRKVDVTTESFAAASIAVECSRSSVYSLRIYEENDVVHIATSSAVWSELENRRLQILPR
jgi:hypothetical protein